MKKNNQNKNKKNHLKEITCYDQNDTVNFINLKKPLKLNDLDFSLPKESPTKVISIRIPTPLYHEIRAFSTNLDMPYQAYMKYLLFEGLKREQAKILK